MRRAPSIKSLESAFPQVERSGLLDVRKAIHSMRDPDKAMSRIDIGLENHGVECIRDRNGRTVALYSNSGDTYAATVLYIFETETFRLSTMGDFVETYERRHAALP